MKEITELTGDDADWVESLVKTLDTLGVSTEPAELDEYLEHARRTWTLAGSDPMPLINLVGAGIGHHLATQLGLRWVYVTDKRGPRLGAVRRLEEDARLSSRCGRPQVGG